MTPADPAQTEESFSSSVVLEQTALTDSLGARLWQPRGRQSHPYATIGAYSPGNPEPPKNQFSAA